MTRRRLRWALPIALSTVLAASAALPAQLRLQPIAGQTGDAGLALMLRKLGTAGTFMMTTAHPDDENSALLSLMSHGEGLRTVLVTATRGDGGQNEIGSEIFDALATLRTEELLAAHRFDGAEQYFTRAVDFGYSFSLDETYEKWGRDAIIGDFVRHIRTLRPDVIVGFVWEGSGGGQHHQASTRLTAEAFRAAADPSRYPAQLTEGLRPWQAAKFYYTAGRGRGGAPVLTTPVASSLYDPVLGRTYDEVGAEARSMHRCQDFPQLLPLPGGGRRGFGRGYHLHDCTIPGQLEKREPSLLDGLDLSLTGLVRFAGPTPPAALGAALSAISTSVDAAERAFRAGGPDAAVPALATGLREARQLRVALDTMSLDDDAVWEIGFRLDQKERQFQDALVMASSVRLDAVADDMAVTPGQPVEVTLHAGNRGERAVRFLGASANGAGAPCGPEELAPGGSLQCDETLTIAGDAKLADVPFRHDPDFERYIFDPDVPFGVPFTPTPYTARFDLEIGGEAVAVSRPVEARNGEDMIAGEKRSDLLVVPRLTVSISPDLVIVPTGGSGDREVRVTVRNNGRAAASGTAELTVPAGWSVSPSTIPVSLAREDAETTMRFSVTPSAGLAPGDATIRARVTSDGADYTTGYQAVEYPHIRRRLLARPAEATVKMVAVRVEPGVNVGYVMGVGDRVPDAIQQLGVPVTLLTDDDLAWGDLSQYRVIMTGVRAYGNRAALAANNERLMDYVRDGGVMLVNYNRTEFNAAQYGPYPAEVSSNRVTDENAPVRTLVPDHPVFTRPNVIGPATWEDWVQERGIYFLGPRAPEYVDLIESEDPFPNNAGPKRGALVEAQVGEGRWIYIGLVLWRELPAGVPGAYQLLANLLSLGSPPPVSTAGPIAPRPGATDD